ncbi:MAG: crotonase/enoyl-CoA hydratase family protein [Desulfobacterales bacterium]|nr:crotonase/enoyl-CoA hydratase family protein [Desulfobacterales bacterium]
MGEYTFYRVEKQDHVGWVFLNRPEKNNAMGPAAWKEAPGVFDALDRDPEIRAVVLAGEGPCFCAGIDLGAMIAAIPEFTEERQWGAVKRKIAAKIAELQEAINAVERCKKPVLAAIHGHCIGAGLDLAAACDIRICSADARFCLKEAGVGFVADVGVLQRLPLIVGQGITRELAFTARAVDAKRAFEILLVSRTYPARNELMDGAGEMARQITQNAPLAVQASKEVLNFGVARQVHDGLAYVAAVSAGLIPTEDLMEALAAFSERRRPKFKGR